jgi:hypothetical protein
MIRYDSIGNALNAFALVSVLTFTAAAVFYATPESTFFDEEWVRHGFCISNPEVPYWNSHDLCLYSDTILVAIGLIIYYKCKGMPEQEMKDMDHYLISNMLAHLGHGLGHGVFGAKYRQGDSGSRAESEHISMIDKYMQEVDIMGLASYMGLSLVFYFFTLKGVGNFKNRTELLLVSIMACLGSLYVKDVLLFTYVQAVIFVTISWAAFSLPSERKKSVSYCSLAGGSAIITIIPWIESTACQNFAVKLGGHLIYDTTIALGVITNYCLAYHRYYSTRNSSPSCSPPSKG